MPDNTVIVLMGVSGSGKTTIGKLLSEKINIPFYDADDFHPAENVEKMKKGIPLNSSDRYPWLNLLAIKIKEWSKKEGAVLACSALKEKYRKVLESDYNAIIWIYLSGSKELIKNRLEGRKDHFMKSDLLDSQFNDLEIPEYGIHIDISGSSEQILTEIFSNLNIHG